jgi:hypothetical protein
MGSMSSYSLKARSVFCCACRGLTTSKDAADAITIAKSIMSIMCSLSGARLLVSYLHSSRTQSGAVRVPTLLVLIPESERRFFIFRAASIEVSVGCADHHFQSVVEGDLLMPASGGRAIFHVRRQAIDPRQCDHQRDRGINY